MELSAFNIRVLTVIPGGFFTDGTTGTPSLNSPGNAYEGYKDIDDYAPFRARFNEYLKTFPGSQIGDPDKFVEVVIDVVRGEGVMKKEDGALRSWPERLILGSDCETDIRLRIESHENTMKDWADVIKSTDK